METKPQYIKRTLHSHLIGLVNEIIFELQGFEEPTSKQEKGLETLKKDYADKLYKFVKPHLKP